MIKVEAIEVRDEMNKDFRVNMGAIEDENELVLVDCGLVNSYEMIKEELAKKGMNIEKLTKVIITHQDLDHMGSLADIKKNHPNVKVLASKEEAKYISGEEEFLRVQNVNKIIDKVDSEKRKELEAYKARIGNVKTVKVDEIVKNGDIINVAGGLEIIETPGHMPGHISVLVKEKKTLITGDALVVVDGELIPSNPQYTLDMEKAKESIKNLLNYDIDTLICAHGGIYNDKVRERILAF
ncbi:MAG: MBL fold metallo-hydrolase [Clostridium sp.]|uniref:MBL fold metallo-hydrolase n=1 Tax=Clostridium sp. TaxID=1506 RepID=UPI003EE59C21